MDLIENISNLNLRSGSINACLLVLGYDKKACYAKCSNGKKGTVYDRMSPSEIWDTIKYLYRERILKIHPDKNGNGNGDEAAKLNIARDRAFHILSYRDRFLRK